MSEATRAQTAAERADTAAGYIRSGRTISREFCACFEPDGDEVTRILYARSRTSPALARNIGRYLAAPVGYRPLLTIERDGIDAVDLGIVGAWDYALVFMRNGTDGPLRKPIAMSVYRRRADERGTYGGWRYECASRHPGRFPNVEGMAELAQRIEAAIRAETEQ